MTNGRGAIPEARAERLITREERRMGSPMTGADWRGSMRYSVTVLTVAIRDVSKAFGWRWLWRRLSGNR